MRAALGCLTCLMALYASSVEGAEMERQVIKLNDRMLMTRPAGGLGGLILTSDQEMEQMEKDPGMKGRAFGRSWEEMCKGLEGYDHAYINVAYDFFFGGDKREYFPTSPQCIRTFKVMHDVAKKHGAGFGASVLNPLDLGPAYYREKGRGGQHHQYQEGELRPDGTFEVKLRVQKQWFHNKGPVKLYVKGVRAFAFSEQRIRRDATAAGQSSYYAVDPDNIVEIPGAKLNVDEEALRKTSVGYAYADGAVVGKLDRSAGRNRVLAVVIYDVEDIDYFHPDALPFLTGMLDAHKAAGITYSALYSDEMHIQFDWDLGTHFGPTEINSRYVTQSLADRYAKLHGARYKDFDRYLLYFAYAQHGFLGKSGEPESVAARSRWAQHVFGPTPADIYATWKFRRDYFRMLQDQVVDLFITAKRHAETIFGKRKIWTQAHATWQESPTCDHVDAPWKPEGAPVSRYDYTAAYEWSSSIRESISGCCDYFRWGDYLTGMGNDFPEGGWIDRNYYGAAMTASFGMFNDVPYSYWGHWGAPAAVSQRVHDVGAAYGVMGNLHNCGHVQDWAHRKSTVLALYPLDLNYVEERYGSWMVQYGYCDYLTEEKFAEMATVLPDGRFRVKDRTYSTLLVLFEPMVSRGTMKKVGQIGESGGKVLWTGPPPAIYHEDGRDALEDWCKAFGLKSVREPWQGLDAEGAVVAFNGPLADVPPFRVLSHLLVDRAYPPEPGPGAEPAAVAAIGGRTVTLATVRKTARNGGLWYFGARPRDDQSGSTSDASRTLYHLLRAIGAYTQTGPGWTEVFSNSGDLIACESPNGAITVARHYYKVVENWPGGFFRPEGEKFDESVLPPQRLVLQGTKMGPHTVSFDGDRIVSFRMQKGRLVGFAGGDTQGITLDGVDYRLTETPANVAFAPVPKSLLADGITRAWVLQASHTRGRAGELTVRLPFAVPKGAKLMFDPMTNGRGPVTDGAVRPGPGQTEVVIEPRMQGAVLYIFTDSK